MPDSEAAIVLENIVKRFYHSPGLLGRLRGAVTEPVVALDRVSLQVYPGEVYGLVGPNGSGKTTLIKVCATLHLPDEGGGLITGIPLDYPHAIRSHIGLLTDQERSFFWRLTGRANLSYFGRLFDLDNDLLKRRIEELSRLLDLEGLLERRYDRCSAGMKQRIALARSLLTGPSVLLLDEPTRSLDPIQAGRLVHLLRRIASEEKIAILASSHQLEYLSEYTDRTGLLLEGRLVEMKSSLGQASGEVVVRIGGDGDEIARFVKLWGGVKVEDSEPGIRRLSFQTGLVSSRKGGWKEFLGQLAGSELEIIDLRTHRSDIRLLYEQTLSEAARPAQASDSPVLPTISKQPGELSIGSARAEERTYSVSRPRRSAWLKALDLLFVEAQTWLSYRFNLIFGLIGLLFFLAGFAFVSRLIGESGQESLARYGADYFTFVVVGIAFAGLQSVALNSLAGMIRKHQQLGTLEFLMLSATPFDRILLASTLISFFGVLGTMTGYVVVGDVVFNADFSRLNLVASLGVFGLSVAAILGFGLLSAGAVMVLKRADALLFYLHSLMLFFGGVFFPIELLPSWLQAISRLLPITYALSALRKTMITGAGLPEVGGELAVLAIFAVIGLPLGIWVFRSCERKARQDGTLLEF